MFEKQMKKVKGRSENYAIYLGKSDEVNEEKFKKNIVSDDNTKCHVIVFFKDEYDFLIKQREDKDQQIMTLNQRIKQLEEEIAQKSSTNKSSTRELYLKIDDLNKQLTKKGIFNPSNAFKSSNVHSIGVYIGRTVIFSLKHIKLYKNFSFLFCSVKPNSFGKR